ncbi:hypothetical protein BJ508DRAFT_311749 [Ascobolus immersus RN42]|uniref:Uncharacterized protein n=1 Tax=Ascobolus immersus RN42 TaxID=1160509 RepID=A0A3N4HPA2_ASCIM|nr:hypothetical protein BJ508DRAFT_311749 [Ascobolus immersus RN42]
MPKYCTQPLPAKSHALLSLKIVQISAAAASGTPVANGIPSQVLHLGITDLKTSERFAESKHKTKKKKCLTVDLNAGRGNVIQMQYITSPFFTLQRKRSSRLSWALRILWMYSIFDVVKDDFSRRCMVPAIEENLHISKGIITVKEEVKGETIKGEKRTDWLNVKMNLEAGEETKKGKITVTLWQDNRSCNCPAEVGRSSSYATWKVVKSLAKVLFHYEVEGRKKKELK